MERRQRSNTHPTTNAAIPNYATLTLPLQPCTTATPMPYCRPLHPLHSPQGHMAIQTRNTHMLVQLRHRGLSTLRAIRVEARPARGHRTHARPLAHHGLQAHTHNVRHGRQERTTVYRDARRRPPQDHVGVDPRAIVETGNYQERTTMYRDVRRRPQGHVGVNPRAIIEAAICNPQVQWLRGSRRRGTRRNRAHWVYKLILGNWRLVQRRRG